MTRFVLRRLGLAVPIVLGVALIVFLTMKISPGDPVALMAGPNASEATRAAIRHSMGLDRSAPMQFVIWLLNAVRGNLGTSISQHVPVLPMVMDAFGNTLILAAYAFLLALIIGLLLGGVGALRPKSIAGRVCTAITSVAVSAPQYSVALIFIIYVALSTGLFPVAGMHSETGGVGDLLWHGFLPALTAALVPAGIIGRTFRSSLLDALGMDFVEAMRARGLSAIRILGHAVHNTMPSLLVMAGLQIGYLLGGVVFVETIFNWPGIGLTLFNAIETRDMPVTQAGVLVSAVCFVLINIIVDTAHAIIDSRVRTS